MKKYLPFIIAPALAIGFIMAIGFVLLPILKHSYAAAQEHDLEIQRMQMAQFLETVYVNTGKIITGSTKPVIDPKTGKRLDPYAMYIGNSGYCDADHVNVFNVSETASHIVTITCGQKILAQGTEESVLNNTPNWIFTKK